MNLQETFDTIVRGLAAQGGPSRLPNGVSCKYRGPNDRKCAIGMVMPNSEYKPHFEDSGTFNLLVSSNYDEQNPPEWMKPLFLIAEDEQFGMSMQAAHDNAAHYEHNNWRNVWAKDTTVWDANGIAFNLNRVGEKFKLDTKSVLEVFPHP